MKNIIYILLFSVTMVLISCNEKKGAAELIQEMPQSKYPVLPGDLHQRLFAEVDYLDFIFHNFPFSMSQSEKPSIQTNLSYIGRDAVFNWPSSCKPVARQFFQIQGEIVLEADIYYSESCYFYVFYEDGVAKYANTMSQNGIGFFKNIIEQAMGAAKQVNG